MSRDQLISWLDLLSVKSGEEFTLASGQKSNVYVDVKKTAMHHSAGRLLAQLLCDRMIDKFSPVEAVGGVVLGGCHLASVVAMQYPLSSGLDVVYVRKEFKEHGTKNLIERPHMFKDQHLVVLEDVVTTGASAIKAAKLLQEEGYDIRGILAVVDRRIDKRPYLGRFAFDALVNFEELTV